jgi:5,5'-dehydrodivanillate O-demethylase
VLRKYWHPLLLSSELPARTLHRAKLLGEDLVLFRLADGEIGVLPAHCPHRGASLEYGFIEKDGLRCAYHGWKFSRHGELMEAPFGDCLLGTGAAVSLSWPGRVHECGGVIFVCLDAAKGEPGLPQWDILLSGSEEIAVQRHEVECNWFQYQENAADLTHTLFLHGARMKALGIPDSSGFYSELNWYAFAHQPFGFVKAWRYEGHEVGWGNVAVFPNILRIVQEMHWRVPIDSERTLIFQVSGRRVASGPRLPQGFSATEGAPLPAVSAESPPVDFGRQGPDETKFRLWSFQGQDAAVCVTQGATADRGREHLVTSDLGVDLYRRAWQKFCDARTGPATAYAPLAGDQGLLDLRPWLGLGHVTVSRPVDVQGSGSGLDWYEIFGGSETLISVPRSSAAKGPLG